MLKIINYSEKIEEFIVHEMHDTLRKTVSKCMKMTVFYGFCIGHIQNSNANMCLLYSVELRFLCRLFYMALFMQTNSWWWLTDMTMKI